MYAKILGVPLVIGYKHRSDHSEQAEVLQVIGDVEGRNVLIVDDFTITGGSLISVTEVLRSAGARRVFAAVSHAVLTHGASQRLANSPIERLFLTDTIENHPDPLPHNCETVSVAPLFATAIRSIHERTSISMLFPEEKPLP